MRYRCAACALGDTRIIPHWTLDHREFWMAERVLGPEASPWRTVAAARAELQPIKATMPSGSAEMLADISRYLRPRSRPASSPDERVTGGEDPRINGAVVSWAATTAAGFTARQRLA
jgi:hypothetical protein